MMMEADIPLEKGADTQMPSRIVVHSMAEFLDTDPHDYHAVEFIRKLGLSAHAFISPSGVVIRSRADNEGAYHAKGFNANSLGVEFLVPGVHTYATFLEVIKRKYLTTVQFKAGVELVQNWRLQHGITQIDRHSDLSPGRKLDPGRGFPWASFLEETGFS